jgi:hypothetical protein
MEEAGAAYELERIRIADNEEEESPQDEAAKELDARLTAASKEDTEAWQLAYVDLMRRSIHEVHALWGAPRDEWTLVPDTRNVGVQLFERDGGFLVRCVLRGRAERYAHVIRDHCAETRLRWDSEFVRASEELECFCTPAGDIRVVRSTLISGFPGIADRDLLGILWAGYDGVARTHKIIFRTTQHWFHRPQLEGRALIGVLVRQLDDGNTEVCCSASGFTMGASVPDFVADVVRERIRDRFRLYERVVKQWRDYYGRK